VVSRAGIAVAGTTSCADTSKKMCAYTRKKHGMFRLSKCKKIVAILTLVAFLVTQDVRITLIMALVGVGGDIIL
jgi:hypothetical protein